MPITSYTPQRNEYILDNLEKAVFLIDGNTKDIHIDNGAAYIDDISSSSVRALYVSSVEVTDESALDERYAFTHTLTFSVQGYANVGALSQLYYFIVKDKNGSYWWLNPLFPSKIEHEFTATENSCSTTFTASTISNFPLLEVRGLTTSAISPITCEYDRQHVAKLYLNEKAYTSASYDQVIYTNDGFKPVLFSRNSFSFSEIFDGENVREELSFDIPMSVYKSSWHYNLLEFSTNTYSGVIEFANGQTFLFGMTNGLQPSFSLNGGDDSLASISITLQGIRASYTSPSGFFNGDIEGVTRYSWVGTAENDAYECVADGVAIYLLEYEADALGNRTGRYRCLQGYQSQFSNYNIVETFTRANAEEFRSSECAYDTCEFTTSLPSFVTLTPSASAATASITCNGAWSITTSDSNIVVTPSAGMASSSPRTITVTYQTMPTTSTSYTLTINYCDSHTDRHTITLSPAASTNCFTQGSTGQTVNAQAQTVNVGYSCCALSATTPATWIKSLKVTGSVISFTVEENATTGGRVATITINKCDGTSDRYRLQQTRRYEEWRNDTGYICVDGSKYAVQRLYTGITSDNMVRTETTRAGELIEAGSLDCAETLDYVFNWYDGTNPKSVNVASGSSSTIYSVTSTLNGQNVAFSVLSAPYWVTATTSSGSVSLTIAGNSGAQRYGELVLQQQGSNNTIELRLTQASGVSTEGYVFQWNRTSASTITRSVDSGETHTSEGVWSAKDGDFQGFYIQGYSNFITPSIVSATVTFNVAANTTGEARTGTVRIKQNGSGLVCTLTVNQAG